MLFGAHTEQVLLGITLEIRLVQFVRGDDSANMAVLYFDRTIPLSAASLWFFRASVSTTVTISTSPQTSLSLASASSAIFNLQFTTLRST